jgi:two-component system, NarL family, nitrate/nitrite response regulator NarL
MSNITLLSASADAAFAASLRTALDRDGGIILLNEAADDEQQILRIARSHKPDVFLIDGQYSTADAVPLLPRIHAASPGTKAILFLDSCGQREIVDAIAQGAKGWVLKASPPEQWLKAIRVIHDGEIWVDRKMLVEAMTGLLSRHHSKQALAGSKPDNLTEREWEVVRWVGQGMTNKEIARQMAISDATVKTHLQNIFGKLKVGRRFQLPTV